PPHREKVSIRQTQRKRALCPSRAKDRSCPGERLGALLAPGKNAAPAWRDATRTGKGTGSAVGSRTGVANPSCAIECQERFLKAIISFYTADPVPLCICRAPHCGAFSDSPSALAPRRRTAWAKQ